MPSMRAEAVAVGPGRRLPRPQLEDVLAGISVAVVLVPQSLACAQLAGMPAYRGLYAAAIPPLVPAPFASSPYLQPGPTAISALLTYGALSPLAPLGHPHYVELSLLLALMVGVIRIALGALRAGVLGYLMSQPLLVGFVPAAALLIVALQLPLALGVEPRGTYEIYRAAWAVGHMDDWRTGAILVALVAASAVLLGKRIHPLGAVVRHRAAARGPARRAPRRPPGAAQLVVRLDGLGRIDLTGAIALKKLLEDARAAGLEVALEGRPAHAARILLRVLDAE